jgi:hypothetical protein
LQMILAKASDLDTRSGAVHCQCPGPLQTAQTKANRQDRANVRRREEGMIKWFETGSTSNPHHLTLPLPPPHPRLSLSLSLSMTRER